MLCIGWERVFFLAPPLQDQGGHGLNPEPGVTIVILDVRVFQGHVGQSGVTVGLHGQLVHAGAIQLLSRDTLGKKVDEFGFLHGGVDGWPASALCAEIEKKDGFTGKVQAMGLLVPAKVLKSRIHGRGLFAAEDIPKGTVVWRFDPKVDKVVASAAAGRRRFWRFDHYAYFDPSRKAWVYCTDRAKWINHSARPNLSDHKDYMRAARRIRKGDEMTENYAVSQRPLPPGSPWAEVSFRHV